MVETPLQGWRQRLHEVIFEADTAAGKAFDVGLLIAILLSVIAVCLESVSSIQATHGGALLAVEWIFTILFSVEYVLRLVCVKKPAKYALSFFGIIDLLAILPTLLSLVFAQSGSLVVIRTFRLLRAFRVFKLAHLLSEAATLRAALWGARGKIVVFLATVLITVTIMGSAMYFVENFGQTSEQYTSIPIGIYWAIVTMGTVGYGDVVPETPIGKFLSAILILLGYSMIIVPTGFVSAEFLGQKMSRRVSTQSCTNCMAEGHDVDATHCKFCGEKL